MADSQERHQVSDCSHADQRAKLSISEFEICLYFREARHPRHDQKAKEEEKPLNKVEFMLNIDGFSQNSALASSLRAATNRGSL